MNPAHGCPWWAVPNSLPAPLTSEQEGDTPVGLHLLCPFTSLISPSIPIMLELRTFYCPLVFIINEKGPEWSFLKFRQSIKTRSWNAILLILEMCEICLVTKKKKKKSEGGGEKKWASEGRSKGSALTTGTSQCYKECHTLNLPFSLQFSTLKHEERLRSFSVLSSMLTPTVCISSISLLVKQTKFR